MIFRKIWCLVVTSNSDKLKSISSWPKMRAKTTENHFRFHFHFKWFPALENRRERERERARRLPTSKQEDCIEARRSHRFDRSNPPSSNPITDHRDRLAISRPRAKRETERVERSSHRKPTCTDEPRLTHSHWFVLVLVWNFCNKICLWFWFFTFSLWSLILLLLLWWHGWWCFGGFPVVWWWVLWGWWWKIAFSECYQTHEIIF